MEKGERVREFGEFWLTGQHMARLVFLSVFCLCLRASCLSQAGRGAAETGSLMRHGGKRGRGEEEKQEQPRENHREKHDCSKPLHFFISFT